MEECRIMSHDRIFIAFTSLDRYDIVESIVYNLANYGIGLWYDRHRMGLSDVYNEIFSIGIQKTKYAVIILTPNLTSAKCFAEEMEHIKKCYKNGTISVFPLLYKIKSAELSHKYNWVKEIIYKEFDNKSGTLSICNQIVIKVLSDIVKICKFQTLYALLCNRHQQKEDVYVMKILESYLDIDRGNHNSRISVLYCLYQYLTIKYGVIKIFPQHYWRCFDRIFSHNKLHLKIEQREVRVLELSMIILINKLFY